MLIFDAVSLRNRYTITKPNLQKKGIVTLQTFRHFLLATFPLLLLCNTFSYSQEIPVKNETIKIQQKAKKKKWIVKEQGENGTHNYQLTDRSRIKKLQDRVKK